MTTTTAEKLRVYIMSDPTRKDVIEHEQWLDIERNADELRMLALEFNLGIGRFREKGGR